MRHSQALVAHTCNPSYSEGRDQEDCGSKPAQANSSWDLILRNPSQKMAGGVAQDVGSEFKPQYRKKKKIIIVQRNLCFKVPLAHR
jgi:hypothetical protein